MSHELFEAGHFLGKTRTKYRFISGRFGGLLLDPDRVVKRKVPDPQHWYQNMTKTMV